ncbi:hypothetical protein BDF20DRAFT_831612 [Mycotypha africana]|uniref:uncharacterized protein n=1 Tax=Mycotypha africana TaxID=64632 RepID=UPI0023001137|nr:uncharacterized protein BDF20DRAFT_831612 [Mycotypha africana]KAI8991585.1 hypothetical protein BDF20DRAFT_831612 [Mycotypha africana]
MSLWMTYYDTFRSRFFYLHTSSEESEGVNIIYEGSSLGLELQSLKCSTPSEVLILCKMGVLWQSYYIWLTYEFYQRLLMHHSSVIFWLLFAWAHDFFSVVSRTIMSYCSLTD